MLPLTSARRRSRNMRILRRQPPGELMAARLTHSILRAPRWVDFCVTPEVTGRRAGDNWSVASARAAAVRGSCQDIPLLG